MSNFEFLQQLATEIARDGFATHANVTANFVKILHAEQKFDQQRASLLVEMVANNDLSDTARSRAFGKLRLASKGHTFADLTKLENTTRSPANLRG